SLPSVAREAEARPGIAPKLHLTQCRSDLDRGRVVVVEPVHALLDPHLLPIARYLGRDPLGEFWAERLLAVLMRLAHHRRGPVPPDRLVAREGARGLAEIFLETGGDDVGVLDRHDATLPEERKGRMTGVAEERGPSPAPAFHRRPHHQRPFER